MTAPAYTMQMTQEAFNRIYEGMTARGRVEMLQAFKEQIDVNQLPPVGKKSIKYYPIPYECEAIMVFTDAERGTETWTAAISEVGYIDKFTDTNGKKYDSMEALIEAGVSKFYLENRHEVDVS